VNSVTTATSAALPPNYLGLLFSRRDFIRGGGDDDGNEFPSRRPVSSFFFFFAFVRPLEETSVSQMTRQVSVSPRFATHSQLDAKQKKKKATVKVVGWKTDGPGLCLSCPSSGPDNETNSR